MHEAAPHDPLGPSLGDNAGIGQHQLGVGQRWSADQLGVGNHGIANCSKHRGRAGREPGEPGCQAAGGGQPSGRTAAVDARSLRRPVEDLGQRPGDPLLQDGVGLQVGGRVVAGGDVGPQHPCVLAGAVVRQRGRRIELGPDRLVDRPVRWTAQRGLVQPGLGQDRGRFDLLVVAAVVAGADDRQVFLLRVQAQVLERGQDRGGLERLEGRPRVDGPRRVTRERRHGAVGCGHDDVAEVAGLDDTVTGDGDQKGGGRGHDGRQPMRWRRHGTVPRTGRWTDQPISPPRSGRRR